MYFNWLSPHNISNRDIQGLNPHPQLSMYKKKFINFPCKKLQHLVIL